MAFWITQSKMLAIKTIFFLLVMVFCEVVINPLVELLHIKWLPNHLNFKLHTLGAQNWPFFGF
jgi:hypothetical protein